MEATGDHSTYWLTPPGKVLMESHGAAQQTKHVPSDNDAHAPPVGQHQHDEYFALHRLVEHKV